MSSEFIGTAFIVAIFLFFGIFLVFKYRVHFTVYQIGRYFRTFAQRTHSHVDRSYQEQKIRTFQEILDYLAIQAYEDCFNTEVHIDHRTKVKIEQERLEDDSPEEWQKAVYAHKQKAEELRQKAKEEEELAEGVAMAFDEKKRKRLERSLNIRKDRFSIDNVLINVFNVKEGIIEVVDRTFEQTQFSRFGDEQPEFDSIAAYVMDENKYFDQIFRVLNADSVNRVLNRMPHTLIMLGITGTFAGFYVSLGSAAALEAGVAIALTSSLTAIPLALIADYINTVFPDEELIQQAIKRYSLTLSYIWKDTKALYETKRNRRRSDRSGDRRSDVQKQEMRSSENIQPQEKPKTEAMQTKSTVDNSEEEPILIEDDVVSPAQSA